MVRKLFKICHIRDKVYSGILHLVRQNSKLWFKLNPMQWCSIRNDP